jgi:hypothetical protein
MIDENDVFDLSLVQWILVIEKEVHLKDALFALADGTRLSSTRSVAQTFGQLSLRRGL